MAQYVTMPERVLYTAALFDSTEQGMDKQHYIIVNGILEPVSEIRWTIWTEEDTQRLKVRESHMVKRGTPDVWGKVLTYFVGIDTSPGICEPYLWTTKLFEAAPFMTWRHISEEQARERHDEYIKALIGVMWRDGVKLDAVEIEVSRIA